MRRDSREAVYKILYAENFNDSARLDDDFVSEVYTELKLSKSDAVFADELLSAINEHKSEIEEIIGKYAKGYSVERLYSTDKCALILAIAEMTYLKNIPQVVTIDEALFLVRKFSTDESLNFVNGILAAYKKDCEKITESDSSEGK